MEEILLLDQNTINKIAAGEVVERPSAVVKELVENAIDAGATAITVEIKGGGIELVRITDNGSGIAKEQVRIAFERHATSKIRSVQDLLTVGSLGFRGEALASIGAVAQVEMVTKTRGALTGSRYVIDGGEEKTLEEIGCPEGTTFVVRNLFYNVPARRKFLKSAQTEASYINDLVERLAMSHPDISFKFMNNNQLRLQYGVNGSINWKGIGFSFMLQGVGKTDKYLSHDLAFPYYYEFGTIYKHQLDYWTPQNTNCEFPRLYQTGTRNSNYSANIRTQTKYLTNGAYMRVKNLTLAYTFSNELIKHFGISNLRIYATGENLFTFDHLPKGLDPSLSNKGGGMGYPFMKSYSFGLSITL